MNIKKLLERLINKWPAKMISLAAAILIVVFHRINEQQIRYLSTPLEVQENGILAIASPMPQNVRIALRGSNASIYPVMAEDVHAYLDLSRYNQKGTYRVPVQIHKTGSALAAGTMELRVEPADITLTLDKAVTKYVRLDPLIHGDVAEGYAVVSQNCVPNQVQIEGPEDAVNKIGWLGTNEVNLTGRTEDFSQTLRIANPGDFIEVVGRDTAELTVRIRKIEAPPPLPESAEKSDGDADEMVSQGDTILPQNGGGG